MLDEAKSIKAEFFTLGFQYYVAARLADFAQLNPVCANLFHHAIEMFLKGGLAERGLPDLKKIVSEKSGARLQRNTRITRLPDSTR